MDASLASALAGQYRIDHEIGAGGMATVYLAHDLKHDRSVALKLLRADLDPRLGQERFEREIRLAARLHHPHILPVLDSGVVSLEGSATTAARRLFYTMPYVAGESLRARLQRERQLPVRDAIRIARQAAQALQYAHDAGVIHRDIKPDNILLTKDSSTLVTDFGIARSLDAAVSPSLTGSGVTVGTPIYMSPEQSSGDELVDARTDVYSLGVVLYEMLAGEPPFTGPTAQAIMLKRLSLAPPSVRVTRPTVPPALDAALQYALAPVPGDRMPSAAAMIEALDAAAAALTDPQAAVVPRAPSRPRIPVIVAVMALLALAAAVAWPRPRGAQRAAPAITAATARLAVLPFENLGDTADAYFADGVTDAVRGRLSSLSTLQVIARSSSLPYAGGGKTPQQVADELGVRYLLTGTVRWARGADGTSRVLVSPELVEVGPDGAASTRWQQAFDAPLTDVFQVQGDIAARVTEALRLALPGSARSRMADVPTTNPEAYDAYLRGLAARGGGTNNTPAALRRARSFYEQAVALDSTFASAWGGIALTSTFLYANSVPAPDLADRARTALERMTALDPDGIETHIVRSRYLSLIEQDNDRALAELEAVLPRAPNDAFLLSALSNAERSTGRWDDALAHAELAFALDPRNASRASALSIIYLWTRRPDSARGPADRALALAPNPAHVQRRAMVSLAEGDLPGARAVLAGAPEVPAADLAAYMANIWDLGWVLDSAGQALVLSLGPDAFDGDRASLSMARSQMHAWQGDSARMRTWADSAARYLSAQLREAPDDAQRLLLRGFMRARLGRSQDARADLERGLSLSRKKPDTYIQPFYEHTAARAFLQLGERDRAVALLEDLMRQPYFITPAWLSLDPDFAPLRDHPRFQRLIEKGR